MSNSIDEKRRINIQILRTKDTVTGSISESALSEDTTIISNISSLDLLYTSATKPTIKEGTDDWVLPTDNTSRNPLTYTSTSDEYLILGKIVNNVSTLTSCYYGKFAKSGTNGILTGTNKKALSVVKSDLEESVLNYGELLYLDHFNYLLIGDGVSTVRELLDAKTYYQTATAPAFVDASFYGTTNIYPTAYYREDIDAATNSEELANTNFVQEAIQRANNVFISSTEPILNRPVSSNYDYFAIWIDTSSSTQKIKYTEVNTSTGAITWKELTNLVLSVETILDSEPTKATTTTDKHLATTGYVKARIEDLDYIPDQTQEKTKLGAGKTITSITQTDGKIAIETSDISITYKQISDEKKPHYSEAEPLMNGTASAGSEKKKYLYSREDHVHPSDTSKPDKDDTVKDVTFYTADDSDNKKGDLKQYRYTKQTDGTYKKTNESIANYSSIKTALDLNNVTNESKETMFTSPTFTGTTKAPTVATTSTSDTQIATTAFVHNVFANFGQFIYYQDTQPDISGSSELTPAEKALPRLWIHSSTGIIKIWTGSAWKSVYSIWG